MKIIIFTSIMLSALLFQNCTSSKSTPQVDRKEVNDPNTIEDPDLTLSLVDHLRSVPGLIVNGDGQTASVRIRGISSINSSNDPLFLVDGQQYSGGLQQAVQMIPVNNIKSIRVLKNPSDTAMYGVRGANGVIHINLK